MEEFPGKDLTGGRRELTAALRNSRVIALTGGGGKTTLLYFLAEYFLKEPRDREPGKIAAGERNGIFREKKKILLTTTTKIRVPRHCPFRVDAEGCREDWAAGRYAAAGIPFLPQTGTGEHQSMTAGHDCGNMQGKTERSEKADLPEKLAALPGELLAGLCSEADVTLIEADGAKHHPVKLPAEHEPVIPEACDTVIAVAGLSALGKTAEEACFRWERFSQVPGLLCGQDPLCTERGGENGDTRIPAASGTGGLSEGGSLPESAEAVRHHRITEEDLAMLLASGQGGRKGVGSRKFFACLNQCDNEERREKGGRILKILREKYGIRGFLTTFPEEERERYC